MFELKEREREMVHHMAMKLHCVVHAEAVGSEHDELCVCMSFCSQLAIAQVAAPLAYFLEGELLLEGASVGSRVG